MMRFHTDERYLTQQYLMRRTSERAANRIPYITASEVFMQNLEAIWRRLRGAK